MVEDNTLLNLSRTLDKIMDKMAEKDKKAIKHKSHTSMIEAFFKPNPDKYEVLNRYAKMYYDMPLEELRKRKELESTNVMNNSSNAMKDSTNVMNQNIIDYEER